MIRKLEVVSHSSRYVYVHNTKHDCMAVEFTNYIDQTGHIHMFRILYICINFSPRNVVTYVCSIQYIIVFICYFVSCMYVRML